MITTVKKEKSYLLKADSWQEAESKLKKGVVVTSIALASLFTACSTPAEKIEKNERVLVPMIENFVRARADALTAEEKYNEAKARGDALMMETQEKQMNHLREVAIEKAEGIIKLQEKNTKLLTKQMDKDEKKAKKAKTTTITRADALNFTP